MLSSGSYTNRIRETMSVRSGHSARVLDMKKYKVFALVYMILCAMTAATSQAQAKLPPNIKKGFVTTRDGVRIHYIESKPRSPRRDSTLLFVPGLMTPGWIWEHQLAYFDQNYRVVAMDPRSQGESSKPAEGHYPAARARDIKSVVDQLKLKPVVLVAYTSAVTEVVSYVDQFGTETLAGLVLINGIAGRDYDEATMSSLLAYSNAFQLDRQKAADRFVRGLYRKPQSEDYIRRMIRATLRMPTNSVVALIMGGIASDNRAALAKIDKPTLIVVALVRPWMSFYEDMQKRIRGARMEVFDDAGHALFVDEAARFNTLLDEFLNTLEPG